MRFKSKAKDYRLIVKVRTSFGETIDIMELDRFSGIFFRGFLRPKLIKKNLIEYTGPVGISLYDKLKQPIEKREFLFIMEQIVVAIDKLHENQLPINNLVMDIQHIFINEITKEMQFLYVPMVSGKINSNLIELIESIVYSVKPVDDKDSKFASRFIYFFRSLNPFDIAKIEKFIAKEDRSVVNTIRKQNITRSGFMTNKPQHYYEHYYERENMKSDDEATSLLEDNEATGLINKNNEPTGFLEDEATGILTENYDAAVENIGKNAVNYPILVRILTDEEIVVNKPVFRIGKEKSYVDYFVTNNIAVSRSHADIITRGRRYFVKDLNSKNHTYINGNEIPVHCEVEINDGDYLKLGNEEFVFRK